MVNIAKVMYLNLIDMLESLNQSIPEAVMFKSMCLILVASWVQAGGLNIDLHPECQIIGETGYSCHPTVTSSVRIGSKII